MEVLYLLVPLSLLLVGCIVWAFLWAVRNGQMDDLEGPAERLLRDDDRPFKPPSPTGVSRGAPDAPH